MTAPPPETAVVDAIRAAVAASTDSTIPAADAATLVAAHGLGSVEDLALQALPVADEMSRPRISGFRVAGVGIEAQTGDLLLGANLEFPGTELTTTIHAEGFIALRARRRGHDLAVLALPRAFSCAFCRQTLAEAARADRLTIIDPLGHRVSLVDLYPHQFAPSALGMDGDTGGIAWPDVALEASFDGPAEIGAALIAAGSRAHAPYSKAPSAVVVRLRDDRLLSAGCVESVSFNPSISAMQAALVEVAAARAEPGDVVEAWLALRTGGSVDPEPGFRALVHAVAPAAIPHVVAWRDAG